jgi:hypothetical protein
VDEGRDLSAGSPEKSGKMGMREELEKRRRSRNEPEKKKGRTRENPRKGGGWGKGTRERRCWKGNPRGMGLRNEPERIFGLIMLIM